MSKKIVAMLMAVAMAFSLLPVTALATGETNGPADATSVTADTEDGVHISKKVEKATDGNYNLVMEAYVEGNTKIVASSKPLDIVLVLDVSGSMAHSQGWGTEKKIVSLKSAVNNFIDEVAKKNIAKDGKLIGHRISIVKFASNKKDDVVGNDTYMSGGFKHNYSQIVENLITVDDAGKERLTAAVNGLEPAGTTRADYGMELAKDELEKNSTDQSRAKVVVMFTDGEPTSGSTFEDKVASAAISASKALKDKEVKVYTVGIFNNANPKADVNSVLTYKENKYMHAVSSNYPGATFQKESGVYTWSFGERAQDSNQDSNYYLSAKNSTELKNVFQTISNSITTTHVTANKNAVLRDTLTKQFVLNGTDASAITVKKAKVTGKTGNTYSWGSLEDVDGIMKEISSDRKTVTVTGFDYTSTGTTGNVITKNGNDYSGYKLIVTIPIKVNQDYDRWEAGKNNYNTNVTDTEDNKAGLTNYKKGEEEASTLLDTSPQVPVTAYTVKYDWGTSAPARANIPTNSNTYLTGKTYPVDTTYATDKEIKDSDGGTWHFSGWTDPNNGVMGTNNVTITGLWTYTAPTYTLTYDANGGQFGSGDSASTTKPETNIPTGKYSLKYSPEYTPTHAKSEGKDVIFLGWSETDDSEKIYDKGDTIPNLIQSVTIDGNKTVYAVWGYDAIGEKGQPDGVPDVFNAVVTYNIVGGTWDGTHASATEVIKVKELKNGVWENTGNKLKNIPGTMGVTPDKNHTLPGSWGDSDPAPTTETVVTADKIYTYTLSEVTTGTLTITKKVVGLPLNQLPDEFTIKVTAGNETKELKKANTTSQDQDNSTLTWTMNLPAGTYTVSEEKANVEDYTYTTTYGDNQANSATVDVRKGQPSTMTVTNTYTENATVNLSQLIQKQLTVKDGSTLPDNTTFTVTVTPKTVNNQPATSIQPIPGTVSDLGTGTPNGDGDTIYTASFDFTGGTLSLPAGTYTYTVQEDAISPISGMQYDSNTYTLTIEVKNSTATVKYTTREGTTPTEVSTTKPLTIQNTYQTPDLTVEKKTVSVDGKKFDSNTVARVGNKIIWSVTVTNKNSTPAHVTLTDAMAEGVYTDNKCETPAENVNWNPTAHSWTATVSGKVTYYVNYTVKAEDISKGNIVNTIVMKNGDEEKTANSDPVSTWDTKQLKSATGRLETSDWTTTVTLKLPKVNSKPGTQSDQTIAISKGSYVIDEIGDGFTLVGIGDSALENGSFTMTVGGKEITGEVAGYTVNFGQLEGDSYPYTVTYTPTTKTFVWNINKDVYAGTEVTLSYKLKLTNPQTGTYGVKDLNGDGKVDDTGADVDTTKALYTNKSAVLYKDDKTKLAEFPMPSVSYTVSSGSSGSHSGGSRPSLNTKDHYGYIIGYPVDYYTGQPTTDQTKKPVRPEGKITRAEVATIYFRMLTDESRTKFWSQSNAYSDVKTGDWFNNAVSTLSNAGIIAGYEDGSFRPNGYITRAEFATIAARFFDVTYNGKDLFPDISGHWAKDYINQAANKGFVNGYEDGTFKPDRNITRAEAVTLVNRTLDRHPDKNHFTKDMLVWPDNMDQTKWYYADMQEATNSHTYQMKENSDKTKYENWTKTLPIRNWEALEKAWSNANSSQGNGNVV